ncbi:MAG: T9SS type A sorting domain-containing protein [Ignavibacteriae bacterium]|nr:T9SS type A sorting domain-containing protein [Ignavibacteriota bacterium]
MILLRWFLPLTLLLCIGFTSSAQKKANPNTFQILTVSMSGMKWNDADGNGTKDAGETGISGWKIYLTGAAEDSQLTDVNGYYSFTNLTAGTYTLSEEQQSGWSQTFPASPGTYTVTLNDGDSLLSYDFGNRAVHSIVASAGENGAITPSGTISVLHGNDTTFTIAPNTGYHIADVLVDDISVGAVPSYQFPDVTADHTISASFAINTYTLTVNASNGSVLKNPNQLLYDYGSSVVLTATPSEGYNFANWSGDLSGSENPDTILMDNNKTVTANFALQTFSITATTFGNGTITPPGVTYVSFGGSQVYIISPNTGYHIDSVVVDGVNIGSDTSYEFTAVIANHSINAYFSINMFTITAFITAGGTTSPVGDTSVAYGTNVTYNFYPDEGYHIENVWVDSVLVGAVSSYSFTNVTTNHFLEVQFAINTYALNITIVGMGSVVKNPDAALYNHGTTVQLTAFPALGYFFGTWSGDASGFTDTASVTMTSAKNVTATFVFDEAYLKTFRTASYDVWSRALDRAGKFKAEKKKNANVVFQFNVVADPSRLLMLEFSMTATGYVTPKNSPTDTLDTFTGKLPPALVLNVNGGDSITVYGIGNQGKKIKVKYAWGTGKKLKLPDSVFVENRPTLPMPNLHNVGEMLFGKTTNAFPGGLLMGIPQGLKGGNSVLLKKYADVQSSMRKKNLFHTTQGKCLDSLGGKLMSKQQKSLPPNKHNNALFAELLTLKLNIMASIWNYFPNGFGELTFDDPNNLTNPFNGKLVTEIVPFADSLLSCLNLAGAFSTITPAEIYSTLAKIDSAFNTASVDTLSFADSLRLTGVKPLFQVPFLQLTPGIIPKSAVSLAASNSPDERSYRLEQNYPNPFNPTTNFEFRIADFGLVTLKVFNLLGQEVVTLINNEEMDEGEFEIEFDASNLPSGIYFYRLEATGIERPEQSFTQTRKMILIR